MLLSRVRGPRVYVRYCCVWLFCFFFEWAKDAFCCCVTDERIVHEKVVCQPKEALASS